MVKRIDEDESERMQPMEEYVNMSRERLVRGCSAMHRAIEQLGSVFDGTLKWLGCTVQALAGQEPRSAIEAGGEDPFPIDQQDYESQEMQHAMASQFVLIGLRKLVDGVNEVAEVTGGDIALDARLHEDIAQASDELGRVSFSRIVEMLAASKSEQARELSEVLADDPSSKS